MRCSAHVCTQVAENSKQLQAEEEKPRKQIIVEVMVDILLDMEGITVHKGLMYVLEENLNSYPVSGSYTWWELLASSCGTDVILKQ